MNPGEPADLHKKPVCSDVSTYSDVFWEGTPRQKCDSTFTKKCEDKTKKVTMELYESNSYNCSLLFLCAN